MKFYIYLLTASLLAFPSLHAIPKFECDAAMKKNIFWVGASSLVVGGTLLRYLKENKRVSVDAIDSARRSTEKGRLFLIGLVATFIGSYNSAKIWLTVNKKEKAQANS